jgi:DNA-binding NtrC family response regulator
MGTVEASSAAGPVTRFGQLEAVSSCMRELFETLERVAASDLHVLLVGEAGTEKEAIARAIHEKSARGARPFVVLDGSGVQDSEELSAGLERAEGGTLFLAHVDGLLAEPQARLARALSQHSARQDGSEPALRGAPRLLSSTTQDLRTSVQQQEFSGDLYFQLTGALVSVPPLRARPEDLRLLVQSLLAKLGHPNTGITNGALALLELRCWPGNLLELENALRLALAFADGGELEARHFRFDDETDDAALARLPLGGQPLARLERAAILQTLALTRGAKSRAARLLGIAVSTLYDKLKKYEL